VDEAAAAVEAWIEKDEAARKEIARISNTIVNSGKLENYGTPRCQEILRKWAEKYK
jgi:anti-sigma factor RsiW